jgi:putative peptidoglycan lipid II flippase
MDAKRNLMTATIGVVFLTLACKIFGFLREMVIAAFFGTSMVADAYQISNTIPLLLFESFSLAVGITFIPIYTEILNNQGKAEAKLFTGQLAGTVTFVMLILSLLGVIFAPQVIRIIAPGFTGEKLQLTVHLSRIMLPLVIFRSLSGITQGFLNCHNKFFVPAMTGLMLNAGIIGIILFFSKQWGITSAAIGTLVGVAGMLFIQLPQAIKLGFSFSIKPVFRNPNIIKLLKLCIPIFFGTAIQQISLLIDRMMASNLSTGAISALTYANRLNGFVMGIFVLALASVFFPSFSELANKNEIEKLKSMFTDSLRTVTLFVLPIMVGFIVLGEPIVRVLFERGAFNSESTQDTRIALVMYSVGLIGFSYREIFNRIFYSLSDSATPTKNGVLAVLINIILNFLFIGKLGHAGLALATSISGIMTTILLFMALKKKIGIFVDQQFINAIIKMVMSVMVMGVVAFSLNNLFGQFVSGRFVEAILLFATIAISALVYFILAYILGISEVRDGLRFLLKNKFTIKKVIAVSKTGISK